MEVTVGLGTEGAATTLLTPAPSGFGRPLGGPFPREMSASLALGGDWREDVFEVTLQEGRGEEPCSE